MDSAGKLHRNLNRRSLSCVTLRLALFSHRLDIDVVTGRKCIAFGKSPESSAIPLTVLSDQAIPHTLFKARIDAVHQSRGAGISLANLGSRRVKEVPEICLNSVLQPVKTMDLIDIPSAAGTAVLKNRSVGLVSREDVDIPVSKRVCLRRLQILRGYPPEAA